MYPRRRPLRNRPPAASTSRIAGVCPGVYFGKRTCPDSIRDPPGHARANPTRARDHMGSSLRTQDLTGVAYQTQLVHGRVDEILPAHIATQGIDLVVMGSPTRTGIAGLIAESTAEQSFPNANCAVLVVKPPDFVSPITPQGARGPAVAVSVPLNSARPPESACTHPGCPWSPDRRFGRDS